MALTSPYSEFELLSRGEAPCNEFGVNVGLAARGFGA